MSTPSCIRYTVCSMSLNKRQTVYIYISTVLCARTDRLGGYKCQFYSVYGYDWEPKNGVRKLSPQTQSLSHGEWRLHVSCQPLVTMSWCHYLLIFWHQLQLTQHPQALSWLRWQGVGGRCLNESGLLWKQFMIDGARLIWIWLSDSHWSFQLFSWWILAAVSLLAENHVDYTYILNT